MGLGDLIGQAADMMGGDFDLGTKLEEEGVDASMLEGVDIEQAKAFIEEKGFDMSMLESLGLDVDELLAKFTRQV